jgi:hypothetical protein
VASWGVFFKYNISSFCLSGKIAPGYLASESRLRLMRSVTVVRHQGATEILFLLVGTNLRGKRLVLSANQTQFQAAMRRE